MKALYAIAAAGLVLMMGTAGSALAQYYPAPPPPYREPDYYEYERPRYRERDYYEERGPRYRGGGFAFDERWYLRCNPDVLHAVRRGQMESGWAHYQRHGRYEGRRLRC